MAQTTQQKELIALAALVVIAGSIWYFHVGRSTTASSGLSANSYSQINAQDYGRIFVDLTKAQGTEYKSAGRNIFVMGALQVEAANRVPAKKPFVAYTLPQPPPRPEPAKLPMVFFGYGMLPAGGARQGFLQEEPPGGGGNIGSEGEGGVNQIRILHIGEYRIGFEDTATGQKGSKELGVPPA